MLAETTDLAAAATVVSISVSKCVKMCQCEAPAGRFSYVQLREATRYNI